jgi:hypothetical protein
MAVDISLGGVGMVLHEELPVEEIVVALQLESKSILARVTKVSSSMGTVQGRVAWRVGTRFAGIDAEDHEVVDRFVKDLPIDTDPVRAALYQLRTKPDEAMKLLPPEALEKIYAVLVRQKLLAPLTPGQEPLVKMRYIGTSHRDGKIVHGLRVDTRIIHAHYSKDYITNIYFDDGLKSITTGRAE